MFEFQLCTRSTLPGRKHGYTTPLLSKDSDDDDDESLDEDGEKFDHHGHSDGLEDLAASVAEPASSDVGSDLSSLSSATQERLHRVVAQLTRLKSQSCDVASESNGHKNEEQPVHGNDELKTSPGVCEDKVGKVKQLLLLQAGRKQEGRPVATPQNRSSSTVVGKSSNPHVLPPFVSRLHFLRVMWN